MTKKPKFKVGDIVRPVDADRSTRMKIETVSANHAGPNVHRYYGKYNVPKGAGSFGRYEDELMRVK